MVGGGVAGVSNVAGLERGERRSSPSSSGSHSSLASLCRLLTHLAGGDSTSGGEGGGGVAVFNRGVFLQAGQRQLVMEAADATGCRMRRWQRRLDRAFYSVGASRL